MNYALYSCHFMPLSPYKRQNQFDENEEWDKILQDHNLAPKSHLSTITKSGAETAERALIEDTEEYNSILQDIEQETKNFLLYAERESAQISLLNRQRNIVLENQKRIEEEIQQKRMEIEQELAKKEHWRAERNPKNVEQNRVRTLETETMLQCTDAFDHSHAFFGQNEELDTFGAETGKFSKSKCQHSGRKAVALDSDSEDGGVLVTLEVPDSSVHFDGGAIIHVITDCRTPNGAETDWEDLDPNDRAAFANFRTATNPPLLKGNGKKQKSNSLAIDWDIHRDYPTSEDECLG
ncbi:hypothetical protein N431DRAFT_460234 [Stipitochalara longipes BDJ]|nr:hypothetical protein N431DRAFT_460234 [Stipitochalara longipes BDJ]